MLSQISLCLEINELIIPTTCNAVNVACDSFPRSHQAFVRITRPNSIDYVCSSTTPHLVSSHPTLSYSLQISYMHIFLFCFITHWIIYVTTGLEPSGGTNEENNSLSPKIYQ